MEWLGLMPEMMDAVVVVYICVYDLSVFFSFHNFISKCPTLSLALQVQCLSIFGSHLHFESHSVSHQEAMFFLFQIVLVDLSGFSPPLYLSGSSVFIVCDVA